MFKQLFVSTGAVKDPRFNSDGFTLEKLTRPISLFTDNKQYGVRMSEVNVGIEISAEEKAGLEEFFWDNYDPLNSPLAMLEELDKLIEASYDDETYEVDATKLISLWHKYNPKGEVKKTVPCLTGEAELDAEIDALMHEYETLGE